LIHINKLWVTCCLCLFEIICVYVDLMSSSWPSLGNDKEESGECYCGMRTYLKTSWTKENPRRRFFRCAQYDKGPHCKCFQWFEPRICEHGGELIHDMRVMIKTLEEEFHKQEKKRGDHMPFCLCHGDYLLQFIYLFLSFMCSF
jgi:hypothetical protein